MSQSPQTAIPLIVLFAGLASKPLPTEGADKPVKQVSVEGVTEYRLENGLTVLLYPDMSQPTVTVNLTIFVGSRQEGYGEAGMAHLLEHMLFKGTPEHSNIPQLLQERGARFNGSTWLDRTNYYETLPASDENLEFTLRLEADRMVNSYVKGEDLASEMTVVRNEFERGENMPHKILRQRISSVAYDWHNYGKSTIGNRSDIERVPLPKLREFYRRHYQPDNALLVIAGKFDVEKSLRWTQKYFGAIPQPKREVDRTYTEEPAQDGERTVTLRRVGEVALVGVGFHVPAGPHSEFAAIDVLNRILTSEPNGRLYKSLVETKLAARIGGSAYSLHDPGLLTLLAQAREVDLLEQLRERLLATIDETARDGVSDSEVIRAQQQFLKRRELALANTSRFAVELSEWAAQGDWRLYFLFRDRVEAVTTEDVNRVAEKYLQPENRTVGIFLPTDEPRRVRIPSAPDVAALVRDYRGREGVTTGEAFDVTPANIDAHTECFQLAEGINTVLLSKRTRGEAIHLDLTLRYGDLVHLRGKRSACEFLPDLMVRGTQELDYNEIRDKLDQLRSTLYSEGVLGQAQFYIQTSRDNLRAVLDLLGNVLRKPGLRAAEFESLQAQRIVDLEQQLKSPQARANRRLRRLLSPYPATDVRYVPTLDEDLTAWRKLEPQSLRQLHTEFLSGQAGQLVLVGDFDVKEVRTQITNIFADWKSQQPYERIPRDRYPKPSSKHEQIEIPDKANANFLACQVLELSDQADDFAAVVIGNFIFGGGALSSRLGDRVRQQEGLSYGVRAYLALGDRHEPWARWSAMAISNPTNTPRVVEVVDEELRRLLKDGVDEKELARAQQGYLQRQQVRRANDQALANILSTMMYLGRDMSYYTWLDEQIRQLTVEQVNSALRKYVDPNYQVVVTAGDFAGAQENAAAK